MANEAKVMPQANVDDEKYTRGGENDLSLGPVKNRSCTDCWCLVVLAAAWVVFVGVTLGGLADGDPSKLYLPRDYSGAYCDTEKNWNDGPNLKGFPKLAYTMNVTSTTNLIAKQLVCSSFAASALTSGALGAPLLGSQALIDAYLCDCCLVACAKCTGSLGLTDLSSSNLQSTISGKMSDLTGATSASNLFSPSGANGQVFSNMWEEATKYFNQVCLPDCSTNFATMNETYNTSGKSRSYTYSMSPDEGLYYAWTALKTGGPPQIQDVINSSFTFMALPLSLCPYTASKCVPMPGVEFKEVANGYCSFEMAAEVMNGVGSAASTAFASLGGEAFTANSVESFGNWVGDFMISIDAFIVVAVCSFVIALIFMVLLRFMLGYCVWFAVWMVMLILAGAGVLSFSRGSQCQGESLLSTAQQMSSAVVVASSTAATNTASGSEVSDETLEGDGGSYSGVQTRSVSGLLCIPWGVANTTAARYTNPPYNVTANHCRNPYLANDTNKASTIWCYTSDPVVTWEQCLPIGVIRPVCANGYAVTNAELRQGLEYIGYVLWIMTGLYVILVLFFVSRIRLAVAVNEVAATFVAHTPRIVFVPVVQAFFGIAWVLAWSASAAFLISQVPDGYVRTDAYATYAEAYGTETTAGQCTDKWPTGSVWKDEDNCVLTMINTTGGLGMAPSYNCWKCAPPRYIFDARFAASFFVFLWSNALNIAIGQCVIAGAVGVWFFTPNFEKGKRGAIKRSCWNVFRYHLGSLAFGSFIIAVIQFIRALLYYYQKQAAAQKNRVMVIIFRVLGCLTWCFEKCVKFLNKNAYIQIALMGTSFCTSAKKAFFLILRNALRFGTVAVLGAIIHKIGFFFIMAASMALGYLIISAMHPDMSPLIPMVVYFFMSYVISELFMNVFGLAVDSTLQCFLACEEMEMGGDFVPKELSRWLEDGPLDKDPTADPAADQKDFD